MMNYKGYIGAIEVDPDADIIFGRVINTRDVITFQGTTPAEAKQAFQDSVDDYLEFCAERGEAPEKPYSGTFPVRTTPEVHRALVVRAAQRKISLNQLVNQALRKEAMRSDIVASGPRKKQTGKRIRTNAPAGPSKAGAVEEAKP